MFPSKGSGLGPGGKFFGADENSNLLMTSAPAIVAATRRRRAVVMETPACSIMCSTRGEGRSASQYRPSESVDRTPDILLWRKVVTVRDYSGLQSG